MDGEACQGRGVTKSQTRLSELHTHTPKLLNNYCSSNDSTQNTGMKVRQEIDGHKTKKRVHSLWPDTPR